MMVKGKGGRESALSAKVSRKNSKGFFVSTEQHTHFNTYTYHTYAYLFVYVSVCVCMAECGPALFCLCELLKLLIVQQVQVNFI